MITFDKIHDNLSEIEKRGEFSSMKVKKDFLIVGGLQEDNPPVGIHYNMDKFPTNQVEEELAAFFKNSGSVIEFEHKDQEMFTIFLRRDLRENTNLCVALLKAIILYIEGTLELDPSYKVPGLNKYVSTETNI